MTAGCVSGTDSYARTAARMSPAPNVPRAADMAACHMPLTNMTATCMTAGLPTTVSSTPMSPSAVSAPTPAVTLAQRQLRQREQAAARKRRADYPRGDSFPE